MMMMKIKGIVCQRRSRCSKPMGHSELAKTMLKLRLSMTASTKMDLALLTSQSLMVICACIMESSTTYLWWIWVQVATRSFLPMTITVPSMRKLLLRTLLQPLTCSRSLEPTSLKSPLHRCAQLVMNAPCLPISFSSTNILLPRRIRRRRFKLFLLLLMLIWSVIALMISPPLQTRWTGTQVTLTTLLMTMAVSTEWHDHVCRWVAVTMYSREWVIYIRYASCM